MPDQSTQDYGKSPGKGKSFFMPKVRRKFVNIGSMTGRWAKIKSKKCCQSDEDLARLLIKSLYKLDHQSRYGGHISRFWKKRIIPKHGSHRIITLQNDVWALWRELKCALKVNSNSQLAKLLINAWYDRADYIQKLCDVHKASQQAPINETQVIEVVKKEAGVAEAPLNETSMHLNLVESSHVNEAFINETSMNRHLVEDASVDKASVTEGFRKTCNHLVEDVPVKHASVSNTSRYNYLVKDAPVNDTSVNNTFRNKYLVGNASVNKALVEDAYARKAPVPVNEAPVPEAFRNKFLMEDASVSEIPDPLNEALVKQEIMPDQSDKISSEPCREVSPEFTCPNVKEECVSEQEECVSEESEPDTEIEDIMNYLKADKKMIKITEDSTSTEDNAELGNRRRSSRVQSRGYRPNYATLDWIDNHEKNVVTMEEIQKNVRRKSTFLTETVVTEDDEFQNDFKSKKIGKRTVKDPDFFPDDIDNIKDFNESDNSSETDEEESYILGNKGDCLTESKTSNKDMDKRKRKISNSVDKNCKKRKKPWVHIKLEEHQDKYSIEIVKSFARKDRNVDLTEELFKCLVCGNFKSTAKDYFEAHIEKHVNKVLECDKCSYVGYSESVLLKHKLSVGHVTRRNKFMCEICGLALYTSEARLSHIGKEHGDPQFQCRFCDEKFATYGRRHWHHRTVHSDHVKYCFNCETDYRHLSLEEFKDHQSSCKVSRQCQVCGVFLASKSGLNRHIKLTHMNERKYQCSTCPYSAKMAKSLRQHELSHRSDHQFFCDKCTFSCVQRYQLKSHMRTHTGEKPYKCSQCKFAAAWNVQLKEHAKVHGMENTVACSHCDIVFRNQKALKMHDKKDHPEIQSKNATIVYVHTCV